MNKGFFHVSKYYGVVFAQPFKDTKTKPTIKQATDRQIEYSVAWPKTTMTTWNDIWLISVIAACVTELNRYVDNISSLSSYWRDFC